MQACMNPRNKVDKLRRCRMQACMNHQIFFKLVIFFFRGINRLYNEEKGKETT